MGASVWSTRDKNIKKKFLNFEQRYIYPLLLSHSRLVELRRLRSDKTRKKTMRHSIDYQENEMAEYGRPRRPSLRSEAGSVSKETQVVEAKDTLQVGQTIRRRSKSTEDGLEVGNDVGQPGETKPSEGDSDPEVNA